MSLDPLTSWALVVALLLIGVGLMVIRAELRRRARDRRIAARLREACLRGALSGPRYWEGGDR